MSRLLQQVRDIDKVHNDFLDRVRHLSHEQFNKKPGADQWSLGQALYHIWFASHFTHGFMDKRLKENKVVQPTSLKTAFRTLILQIALAAPIKFKAPKAVQAVPDEITFADLENSFKKTHANLERLAGGFPKELENKEIFKHPRIGYINASQTFTFLKSHAMHHQPQIENLLRSV